MKRRAYQTTLAYITESVAASPADRVTHSDPGRAVLLRAEVRTRNPNNGATGNSRLAGIIRARRRQKERGLLRLLLESASWRLPPPPWRVVVRRVAPSHGLDPHDGLGAALKGCIDGIADGLGLENDRSDRVTWVLDQRRGAPREYAVEVEVATR